MRPTTKKRQSTLEALMQTARDTKAKEVEAFDRAHEGHQVIRINVGTKYDNQFGKGSYSTDIV